MGLTEFEVQQESSSIDFFSGEAGVGLRLQIEEEPVEGRYATPLALVYHFLI